MPAGGFTFGEAHFSMKHSTTILSFFVFILLSCGTTRQLSQSAKQNIINATPLQSAHVGISIYDADEGKYLYNYQGDKYFVPASNTKIATCYAAMKYLGDSLVGLRYGIPEEKWFRENVIVFQPTGDPTLLHKDFATSPVFTFLKSNFTGRSKRPALFIKGYELEPWGSGWSWNDYQANYMAERSRMPILGNTVTIKLRDTSESFIPTSHLQRESRTKPFTTGSKYFDSLVNRKSRVIIDEDLNGRLEVSRAISTNDFRVKRSSSVFKSATLPFVTNDWRTAFSFLSDTLSKKFTEVYPTEVKDEFSWEVENSDVTFFHIKNWNIIHSQPTDSLLKPLMHRSDNFFAEQALLMVSNEFLGVMNDAKIIDTILKTDFADLPQKPRWADGSGLSRYNLFTPQDFVAILNKMQKQFGMQRIKEIFATGNEGTLINYYKNSTGFLFAKTGTLSGVVALSGLMYTKKNRLLIFSVLVNNHQASATDVRRAVEKFVEGVREGN